MKLYFHKRGRGDWSENMKDFMSNIFPNVEFWNHHGHRGKDIDSMLNYMSRPYPWGSVHYCWGGDHQLFPKLAVNLFRDHCFNKLNYQPQLKNQILYAPRKTNEPTRCLDDPKLYDQLKSFAISNGYELVEWINDDKTVMEQIKAYSESKIIVGCTGSDFANGYWTNEEQLIIEIIPPNHYPGLSGWAYSPDVIKHAKSKWQPQFEQARKSGSGAWQGKDKTLKFGARYGDTYLPKPSHKRNWNYIYLREENQTTYPKGGHCCYGKARDRHDLFTSQDHRDKIQKLMDDFIV
tara:strand:+ start:1478 stop:2353 length:876 start_codon:yes stop_codon:yes gene_type:complete